MDVNVQVLQDVMLRVELAFRAFYRRVHAGETPGYPRFQGSGCYLSFTYPQYGDHGGAVVDGGMLSLSTIGRIRIRLHRPLEGTPKTVTISREADGWYACISCAEAPATPLSPTGRETGIDVGLRVFLITAAGASVENPRHYRKAERQLVRAQRSVAHRMKSSHRRQKAVAVLNCHHQKMRQQRHDFHHMTAFALLQQYDVIYLEGLQVRNLVHNPSLAKSISDASWRQFRTILAGKAAWAGRRVIAVLAHYTSQDCSGSGERVRKSLSMRTHVCPRCGLVLDRDENAVHNILRLGQEQEQHRAGQARQAPTWPAGTCVA
jgi:putative transposase